jgi:hypothetical protein
MTSRPLTGGYGCVDIKSLFGTAIRHFTHSEYDHAFVILDADNGTILEAQPKGSKLGNLSEYAGLPMIFSEDSCCPDKVSLAHMAASKYYNIPYGFLDIVYLGLELQPIPIKPAWLLDAVLDEHNMICSQLVSQFAQEFNHNWRCGQQYAQLVTPGMLATRAS